MGIALMLVGPVPFIPVEPSVGLILFTGALIGFAYAQTMVSTFSRAHNASMKQGYNDDINTYLLISGKQF